MKTPSLNVQSLSCSRGDRRLFSGLSFELEVGQVLHLRGKNGSGKTTLQRSLCGLFHPDSGTISWCGQPFSENPEAFFQQVLYVGHAPGIKHDLTAVENLQFQLRLKGLVIEEGRIWDALSLLGLAGFEDLPARVLSAGQKRRIALARLFLEEAMLWVLDEPFTALDVVAIDLLESRILEHVEQGGMVIITTHQEARLPKDRTRELTLGIDA